MIKQTPSIGRMIAMVGFTLSVFAILIFLWLAFGGTVPLQAQGYRFTVNMPEAATLAVEADVRMAGVNVGKVKSKELDKGGARTIVDVQLDNQYAPIPKDTHAILRQKTLLGETYLELAPGHKSAGMLPDGGRLANSRVTRKSSTPPNSTLCALAMSTTSFVCSAGRRPSSARMRSMADVSSGLTC